MKRMALNLLVSSAVLVAAGCSSGAPDELSTEELCNRFGAAAVEAILGETKLETFTVDQLDECVWTSASSLEDSITLRIEDVPDGQLFVDHAIEATPPERVKPLDLGDGAVLFTDEAVLGRRGDRVVLITGTLDTQRLVPVLEQAVGQLN